MERPVIDNTKEITEDKQNRINKLWKLCDDYVEFVCSDEYHPDNDYAHYIFEAAMIARYGDDVFEFINNKLE